ncbi:2-oxoglutarate dehydrogenase complex, E3 subunit [Candidatus Zinderia insecticola CARI]|uniref:Dihydrolipoyl dehydrogenase n=1 Tax=Zinderia insecticola (strain CARI) TaxID=871271 RepID=E0TIZ3_ZINIC|nr:2-oxoglutarate dehydrogenase complex, E3 subunit [Candidatus Zinderia insecticola CARI]
MKKKEIFEVIVIGAGPGGYIASIKSSKLNYKVACIDNWNNNNNKNIPSLGGTCTNVGCIPSKSLLNSTEFYNNIKNNSYKYGIEINNINFNINKIFEKKNKIILKINKGIMNLFIKNNISYFYGTASFLKSDKDNFYKIKIKNSENIKIIYGKNIIIATGSKPRKFMNIDFDEKYILSNKGALSLMNNTKDIGIIGCGAIGLETATIWQRLGLNVTLFERNERILSSLDIDISNIMYKTLINKNLKINLSSEIKNIKIINNKVCIEYIDNFKNIKKSLFDKIIISIGRIPNIEELNLKNINLKLDKNNFIKVNKNYKTNLNNIWAIGDVVGGKMLAHKAEREAIIASENISNIKDNLNNDNIPSVIYTYPEIAYVGKDLLKLEKEKIKYNIGKFPLIINSKNRILGCKKGIIKVYSDFYNNEILSAFIVSPYASEIIMEFVIALEFKASTDDLSKIIYPHPSISESIKDAVLSTNNNALNI